MAHGFQDSTRFSDEAVQSAQNILLTFTQIGHKALPDTTEAVLDVATAFHKDLNSAAIMVGKALNDPIKGLTALGRTGIQFTADQTKLIQKLVETGQAAKAQKLILEELAKQTGRSAAASADTLAGKADQLANAFDDFKEKVGELLTKFAPPLLEFLTSASEKMVNLGNAAGEALGPALANATKKIVDLSEASAEANPRVEAIGVKLQQAGGIFGDLGNKIVDTTTTVDEALGLFDKDVEKVKGKVDELSGHTERFAGLSREAFKDFRENAADAIADVTSDLTGFDKKWELTARGAIRNMQEMAEKAITMAHDYKALDTEAVPERFRAWLLEQGPDAVHAFVEAADRGQKQWLVAWKQMQDATRKAVGTLRQDAERAGRGLGQGFAQGVISLIPAAVNATAQLSYAAVQKMRETLKVKSPSEVTQEIGREVVQGLINGMEQRQRELERVFSRVEDQLSKLQSRADAFKSAIAGSFAGFLDLSGAAEAGVPIQDWITQQAQAAQQWGAVLKALQAQGLSGPLLDQIASMGPGALSAAQQLLQLGPDSIKLANQQYAAILGVQEKVSSALTGAFFGDRIDKVRGDLHDIGDKVREVEHRLAELNRRLENITSAQSGFHGQVPKPSLFLAHPGEQIDITPRGGGGAAGGITLRVSIGTVVGPGGIRDVAELIRDELSRTGRYNPNIFNGRA